jgi:hypothetical protein
MERSASAENRRGMTDCSTSRLIHAASIRTTRLSLPSLLGRCFASIATQRDAMSTCQIYQPGRRKPVADLLSLARSLLLGRVGGLCVVGHYKNFLPQV